MSPPARKGPSAVNLTQLNAVQTVAQNAQTTADTALAAATSGGGTAGEALVAANAAQTTANTALTNAAAAQGAADAAQGTASTALTNAATAQSAANSAQSTANTALANAATAQDTANQALAGTSYVRINSTGPLPQATGTEAIAIGGNTVASGPSAVALGNGARAIGGRAVSVGAGNTASGNGAVAIGDPNVATGTGAVAIGNNNTATGTGAVALGNAALANGDGAVALGNGSSATGANAVAIGGAATTRAGNVALGTAGSTYTVAGINSAASQAAQSGAVRLVTTDLAGNLGTSQLDVANLATVPGRVSALEGRTSSLERGQRQSIGGIAAAMALGGTIMPPNSTFAVSFNLSTYRGEQGFSAAAIRPRDRPHLRQRRCRRLDRARLHRRPRRRDVRVLGQTGLGPERSWGRESSARSG